MSKERKNFLIGYGERLTTDIPNPPGGRPKKHAYSFREARTRLSPMIKAAAKEIDSFPESICPGGQTVALVTLHPSYLAKSYYPAALLKAYGLDAVGSRTQEVTPEKWARKNAPESAITSELFVAGPRKQFDRFADEIGDLKETSFVADDLIKIEGVRVQPFAERLKPFSSDDKELLLEIVLHAQPTDEDAFILEGFESYLKTMDLSLNLDRRKFFAEGLCFLPLRAPRDLVPEIAKFSFLRLAREMPRLRQFRPVIRTTPGFSSFACNLPNEGPIDKDIRVAIFDGGLKPGCKLDAWVSAKKTKNLGAPVPDFQNHGTAVTSALLFGPLVDGEVADQPYTKVDHYRVLDVDTQNDDQSELYTVLERIEDVLVSRPKYDFINLSLGPDLPIEDNDVHAWTAVLDQLFSDGQTLPTIAAGNSGERDWKSGNARIQTPADCVNALAIGGCDRTGSVWKRAPYSSIGPGRSPGVVKPDGVAFAGSTREPYWVLDGDNPTSAIPITGTSFAAPTALRAAVGISAHFGKTLSPLAIKALLVHGCENRGHSRAEVGWGRIPTDIQAITMTDEHTASVVYQGELRPASWVRMQIPIPAVTLTGMINVSATFCFASPTDPHDPLNYTRSGLEVRFRPHDQRRTDPGQMNADTSHFFQAKDIYIDESDLRADAHKWETTMHKRRGMRGASLRNPVFDVHYNARIGGRNHKQADKIPYALVITVHSPKTKDLYNKIVQRYRTYLEPLTPVVNIPVRI